MWRTGGGGRVLGGKAKSRRRERKVGVEVWGIRGGRKKTSERRRSSERQRRSRRRKRKSSNGGSGACLFCKSPLSPLLSSSSPAKASQETLHLAPTHTWSQSQHTETHTLTGRGHTPTEPHTRTHTTGAAEFSHPLRKINDKSTDTNAHTHA